MGIPPPDEPQAADGTPLPGAPAEAVSGEDATDSYARKSSAGVMMAVLALVSMLITTPLAMFAMVATYPSDGPSELPWVAPLMFFSLPLLLAVPSLVLAFSVMKNVPRTSPDRSSAAFALCIDGLVVALALGPALDQLGNL
jgi:hypothetical protein